MQMILYGCYCSQDTRVWNWTKIKTFQKVKFFSVDSLCNLLPWYLKRSDLAHMVSEIKEVRGSNGGPPWMHAVLPRAFPQMCCNSDCFHDMKFQNGPNQTSQLLKFFLIYYFFIFEYRLDCRQTEWITSWPIQAHVGLWLNLYVIIN
jgi:hypothetical protein